MLLKQIDLTIDTSKKLEIIDITSKINDLIDIEEGIISVFSKHSTSAIVINENENGLLNDFEFILKKSSLNILFTFNSQLIKSPIIIISWLDFFVQKFILLYKKVSSLF